MELPFTPAFFKKIQAYQQLVDYEKSENKNSTWVREKKLLMWGYEKNERRGKFYTMGEVRLIFQDDLGDGTLKSEDAQTLINSLAVRGFMDPARPEDPGNDAGRFNKDGHLAGQVLKETNLLKTTWRYEIWTGLWWGILVLGLIFLLLQTAHTVVEFLQNSPLS